MFSNIFYLFFCTRDGPKVPFWGRSRSRRKKSFCLRPKAEAEGLKTKILMKGPNQHGFSGWSCTHIFWELIILHPQILRIVHFEPLSLRQKSLTSKYFRCNFIFKISNFSLNLPKFLITAWIWLTWWWLLIRTVKIIALRLFIWLAVAVI